MICVLEMRCRMNGKSGAKRRWAHAYNVSFRDGTLKRTGDGARLAIEKHPFAPRLLVPDCKPQDFVATVSGIGIEGGCLARRSDPGRQIRAGKRPGLPDRHAGAGAPADDAAPARPRRRAQHRGIRLRLSRLAAGRLRPARCGSAKRFSSSHIVFQPGLNEDLAATAVWGTQQASLFPGARYDGVFGMWYGKGPGVDRSGDVLKHANYAGTARHGGVLRSCRRRPRRKSSTIAHQSEHALIDARCRCCLPAGVQEYLDLGLLGFAMSRYSGPVGRLQVLDRHGRMLGAPSTSIRIASRSQLPDDFAPAARRAAYPLARRAAGQERRLLTIEAPGGAGLLRAPTGSTG